MVRVRAVKRKEPSKTPAVYDNESLSLEARGLFYTVIKVCGPKGCGINNIFEIVPEDRDKVYQLIMELRNHKHVKRVRIESITEFRFIQDPKVNGSYVRGESLRDPKPISRRPVRAPQIIKKEKKSSSLSERRPRFERDDPKQAPVLREDEFSDWAEVEMTPEPDVYQPSFLKERAKILRPRDEDVPKVLHRIMYRLCFLAETDSELSRVTSGDRGKVASVLGQLRNSGADLTQLNRFEDWWNSSWRSRDRSGQYQPPMPSQVLDFWNIAMKAPTHRPTKLVPTEPKHIEHDLISMMKKRAK